MAVEADGSGESLSILNPFPKAIQGPSLLHDLIAGPSTEGTALECHNSNGPALQLSYKELHQRTSYIADVLVKLTPSESPGIIPLLVPQCAALYVSQIAILKSGAAFCPLNLDVPEERLKFILNDVSASLVITTPEHLHKFDCLPDLPRQAGHQSSPGQSSLENGVACCKPSDPAYIMYTSGSTGTPKAVCISHRAVTQSLLAHDRFVPQFSRFLQFANPTFDVSVFEIFFPLYRGSTLVSCDRTYLLSDLPNIMTLLDVDGAELTPSVVASLIRSRSSVPKLRTLLTIGEMLNPQTVREFAGCDTQDSALFGMYGPTEAAIHCTLQPSFKTSDTVNTIGIPLDTVSCFVIRPVEEGSLSGHISILPIGEVGELAVGGLQLADGYLNREEQTDAVFVEHPTYGRLYRTGDKAKLTHDGILECLGRISKGQVKLRGQRIELGEIEHAASRLDDVHAASASVIGSQLVLFCVADSTKIQSSTIEKSCQRWLPRFMVPNDIVILQDFPYLPSGKTDQKKLESDYQARPDKSTQEHASAVQDHRLLVILRTLINKQLESSTNLSGAGLDSLKAIKLATELKGHGYHQPSAVDILLCSTYKDLESLVTRSKTQASNTDNRKIGAWKQELRTRVSEQNPRVLENLFEVYPCTSSQDAMLVETAKDSKAYVNSVTLNLPTGTTFEHFDQAIKLVVKRHTSLRTGFVPVGHPICAFAQLEWECLQDDQVRSVRRLDMALQIEDLEQFLLHPLQIQFDGKSSPPLAVFHMHHAIYDQWSLDILIDDTYAAINGLEVPARPSFGSVAWDIVSRTSSEVLRKQSLDFWKSYMTGCRASKLPNLTGKISAGRIQSISRSLTLKPAHMASVISQLAISESTLFQAIFGYMLGLYGGETEVTFGSVFSGRTAAVEGIQDVVGPLLTTLPVRMSADGERTFEDVARTIQSSNRSIMGQADVPLVDVKRAANINPSDSLFDSIFVWQGTSRDRIDQHSVTLVDTTDYVEFNLVLEVESNENAYRMKATYRSNVLPEAQVQLLFDQVNQALVTINQFPGTQLKALFPESSSPACMSIYNPEPNVLDCRGGLSRLLSERFQKYSDKRALFFADDFAGAIISHKALTYSELEEQSNQLAHFLLSKNLRSGGLVMVMMEKSLELYVSILAVIKAGCGYLPVIPGTPVQRIKRAIDDCGITFALCDLESIPSATSMNVSNAFCAVNLELSHLPSTIPDVSVDVTDVAYAIWTSGTTGTPKGVMVTQENIVSHLMTLGHLYPVQNSSRLLQSCNQSFDVSVFEIFFTWSQGMCLCSAKNDVLYRDIEHAIRRMEITHLSMTPTVAALVDPDNVPTVEFLVTAGEAITTQVFRRWAGKGLWQGYGPSETTNICSVRPAVARDDTLNNIGPSFANTSTFVLSASRGFDPVPRGALGELCFGGQQVFRGYQNLPEITSSKIIDHPKYGRIYRSGDLGRLAPDGCILIEGRIDSQRKIRGQRIELSEIVAAISRRSAVLDATVLISGSKGNERLIAFWIPASKAGDEYKVIDLDHDLGAAIEDLRQTLISTLPTYMIPVAFVPVTTFPRTRQSKIDNVQMLSDVNQLPSAYFNASDEDDQLDPSEMTQTERLVRKAIRDTLAIQETHIGRNTSLIGVGLDSVSAIKLAANIRSITRVQLDVSSILRRPKLGSLAELIDSRGSASPEMNGSASPLSSFITESKQSTIVKSCKTHNINPDRILPCTPLQEAMLASSTGIGNSAYLNRNVLRIFVSTKQMKAYWKSLLERHQLLRTIFVSTEDSQYPYVQVVIDRPNIPWTEMDSASNPDKLLRTSCSHVPNPVDSFRLPYLLEVCRHQGENYLAIDMHHSLYDANAMSILFEELEQLHRHETLPAPVLFDDFLDFMVHSRKSEADKFFDDMLCEFTPQSFPKLSQGSELTYSAHETRIPISFDELQHYSSEYSISLLSICQAAWSKVLAIIQDTNDLCFGNVVSGRSVPVDGLERLVAPCFNTVPVRAKLEASTTHLDLVRYLNQLNIDTLQYQLHPLRRIQQRNNKGQRLFESMVLLQQKERPMDSSIWKLVGEKGYMDFPCILELVPSDGHISVTMHYEQGLLKEERQAVSICKLFLEAFTSVLRYPMSEMSNFLLPGSGELAGKLKGMALDRSSPYDAQEKEDDNDWTPIELLIRDVLVELCSSKPSNVTRYTTIYRLGLDSISAIQAAKSLKGKDITVTAADILEYPSPAELAKFVGDRQGSEVRYSVEPEAYDFTSFDNKHRSAVLALYELDYSAVEAVRPCTAVQAGMLTSFAQSGGHNYLNHFAYKPSFTTTPVNLRRAWSQVVKAHEILRTAFVEIEDTQHSYAMVTFKGEQENVFVSDGDKSDIARLVEFDQPNNEQISKAPGTPPWRCHITNVAGEVYMHLSMHHAIYDAESIGRILNDLRISATGKHIPPQAPLNDALSYIIKQNEATQSQEDFWSGRMKMVNPSKFPNLHPLITSRTGMFDASRTLTMPRSEMEKICSTQGISLQALFQVAWAKLLASYTGEEQVTFGIVSAGRSAPQTQNACFPCINTLPLACNTATDAKTMLRELTSFNAAVQKHPFTPLSSIQKWLSLPNEALFNTIFAFQKSMNSEESRSAWHLAYEKAAIDYAVSIEVEHLLNDVLRLRTTFDVAILPKAQAEIVLQQLEGIALELLGHHRLDAKDSAIVSMLPPKDPAIKTSMTNLLDMFDQSAQLHANKIALEFVTNPNGDMKSQKWTYTEVDARGNQVANLLQSSGVRPGGIVALCFEKCPEASFAFLGILKAGCTILAIDSTAPSARKEFILSDSKATALLCSASVFPEFSSAQELSVINLNEDLTDKISTSPPKHSSGAASDFVSYILYTSGTTGTPKGCELTNENAVQALLAFQRLFKGRWNSNSVCCQFASYHFDVAILEHFWTWSVGIKMLCAPRDLILEDLSGFIDRFQVTHIDLTPSLGRLLDPATVPSLHAGVFITGGEAVKPEMLKAWGEIGCLFNFYGPTECTIGVTRFPSVPSNGKASNIGWQFDNVGTCVMKPGTQDFVLRGGIGELCIFGKLVGKGYLNRPDLTEDRFPYMEPLGDRIYRTGDLVRILHDDSIDFLGRADSQVKLRGQRLEIDEIIAVIRQIEIVKDAVCIVARHEEKQKDQLVAFVSKATDRRQVQPTLHIAHETLSMISEARRACEERLPGYMVPTHFIPVEVIPLSVNNKQDDKALKQLYETMSTSQLQEISTPAGDDRPMNDTEKAIVDALSATLGTPLNDARPSSNIFSLGLSSISAVQLTRRLKASNFRQASIPTVMQSATVLKLAKALQSTAKQDGADSDMRQVAQAITACRQKYLGTAAQNLKCRPDDIERIAPCTPLQQGMIYRSLSNEDGLYFNRFLFDIGDQDLHKLHDAFSKLVEAVDILRTSFIETDDGHIQVVLKKSALSWISITDSKGGDVESSLDMIHYDWIAANDRGLHKPFCVGVTTGEQTTFCQINIHHALYDGNSWSLLMQQLAELLQDKPQRTKAASFFDILPHGPMKETQGSKEFWTAHLRHAAFGQVQPLVNEQSPRDPLISRNISHLKALDRVRKELQVTSQSMVQAAWTAALAKYHSGPLGLVVSGRSLGIEVDKVIGPLFNTIPYSWRFDADDSWSDVAKRCHNFFIESLPFQHTPLRDISKWLRMGSDVPLFETLFVFQQPEAYEELTNEVFCPIEDRSYKADYPLSFEAEQKRDGSLSITIGAQRKYYDIAMIHCMIDQFERNLSTMCNDPSTKPDVPDSYFSSLENVHMQYGHQDLNGYHGNFEWTTEAEDIRSELAALANIDTQEIDEHTSMFAIGLDSIDAVKLSSRLKKHNIIIAVSALMRSQTIPKMLLNLKNTPTKEEDERAKRRMQEQQKVLERCVFSRVHDWSQVERVLPATPMQEGLVSEMIRSDFQAYFNHDVLEVAAKVDIERLRGVWEKVIDASPILRTAFVEIDELDLETTYAQVILKQPGATIKRKAMDSKDDIHALLAEIGTSVAKESSVLPPFRLTLVEQKGKMFVVISIAHALYDGFSLGLLHKDVFDAYHGDFSPRPQYDDTVYQATQAMGNKATSFWQAMTMNIKPTLIGDHKTTAEIQTHRCEQSSSQLASAIRAASRKTGVTVQALCQTAWTLWLAEHTHTLDVVYGLVLAGRDSSKSEEIMFPTMNTVAFRSSLSGTGHNLVKDIQARLIEMIPYQQTPLRRIQQIARQDSELTSGPLFNTLFTYQKSPGDTATDVPLYKSVQGSSDVEYPLAIEAELVGDELIWRAAVKSSAFSLQQTVHLLQHVDRYLKDLVDDPGRQVLNFRDDGVSVFGRRPFQTPMDAMGGTTKLPTQQTQYDSGSMRPTAEKIRDAVAQVAKVPASNVLKSTRLENLGIDSISAIKVSSILRKQSIALSVSKIIEAGTVGKMADFAGEGQSRLTSTKNGDTDHVADLIRRKGFTSQSLGLDGADIERLMPASAGQVYLLSAWLSSRGSLFCPTFTYRLEGIHDIHAIYTAWDTLVDKHPILRTTFVATHDNEVPFVQAIHKHRDTASRANGTADSVTTTRQLYAGLKVINANSGNLLKVSLHHALYDAVSLNLLMQEMAAILDNKRSKQLETGLNSFLSISVSEKSREQQQQYWKRYLDGVQCSSVQAKYAGRRIEVFDPVVFELHDKDEATLRQHGISIQALFFAVYAQLYANAQGAPSDVVIGIYLANRSHSEDLSRLVAPTVNVLPLRVATGFKNLTSVARQVQQDLQAISNPENSATSLWDIQRWTNVTIDTFVNFIKLPHADDDGALCEGPIRIKNLDDEREFRKRAEIHEEEDRDFHIPSELSGSGVESAYPPTLDVEATVRNGKLAVGVFGYEDRVKLDQANEIIDDVRRQLEEYFA
ncbi:peptide synthetase [Myriangium duriaei CBS 260.36]|uniref:Peptide synthetase n=1 Tax=Myriangium duriaei CBS 260.36 TaxID=1168546 RepID=A0A9P4MNI4_9PEZI|nr:peptide synthetase [Myriangium duriaei CBS 260.36]